MIVKGKYPDITDINRYIDDGKEAVISLKNIFNTLRVENSSKDNTFIIPWNDFFLRYRNELKDIEQWHTIAESHFYKPKLVSLELYGTTELWISLLRANNMKNITEFHFPIIKIYNAVDLMELINIYFKREKRIT